MFKNIFSRTNQWVVKWIDTNLQFSSSVGKAKRNVFEAAQKRLENLKELGTRLFETNAQKEERLRRREQLYAVKELVEKMPTGKSPNFYWDKLVETLQNLGRQEESLEIGKYYTFKYWAKTRGKYFDVYPVSIIISKEPRHVLGVNMHWKNAPEYVESMYRNYVYSGFKSRFYEIKDYELEYVMRLPTFYPIKL